MMENLTKPKKPIYKKWWFITIMVFLVLSVIGALTDDGETENVKEEVVPVVKKEEPKVIKTPESVSADFIRKNFGTNKDEKKKAVISTKFENGVVEATALEVTFWSPKSAKRSFLDNTKDYMEQMKKFDDVQTATLIVHVPLTDQYGNEKNGEVLRVTMNRETLDKINFENFNIENIEQVADEYKEHPALSEE